MAHRHQPLHNRFELGILLLFPTMVLVWYSESNRDKAALQDKINQWYKTIFYGMNGDIPARCGICFVFCKNFLSLMHVG